MYERLIIRVSEQELRDWRRQAWFAGAPSLSAFVRDRLNAGVEARQADRPAEAASASSAAEPDWRSVIERIGAGTSG